MSFVSPSQASPLHASGKSQFPFPLFTVVTFLVADSHSGVADPTELSLQNTSLAPDSAGEDEGINIHPCETSCIATPRHSLKYNTYSTRASYHYPDNHRACFGAIWVDNNTHTTFIGII